MDKKKIKKPDFDSFIAVFPELELPITLTDESHMHFSASNKPLPQAHVHEFIFKIEQSDFDEFTEFVPCFRIPKTYDFHAIIYWRAGLMDYEYTLATFTKKGQLIDKRVIAGTKVHDGLLVRSVATIEEDWLIYVVIGSTDVEEKETNASNSRSFNMELLATGEIIII